MPAEIVWKKALSSADTPKNKKRDNIEKKINQMKEKLEHHKAVLASVSSRVSSNAPSKGDFSQRMTFDSSSSRKVDLSKVAYNA